MEGEYLPKLKLKPEVFGSSHWNLSCLLLCCLSNYFSSLLLLYHSCCKKSFQFCLQGRC